MGKILPILLALVGAGAGIGAGILTRPPPVEEMANPCGDPAVGTPEPAAAPPETPEVPTTFVKLNNQFIVPVLTGGRVASLVVLSLSIEVTAETPDAVFAREPKLRDSFLQVLFDHANAGGFAGNFTAGTSMTTLRRALGEAAVQVLGPIAVGVLIEDIVRQDT
ncbi:MAG: flagellar basal body-associated FliL family protein [Rhodobacteraceae bacterium]|jgi:hypothetical protein|nr:flagellar basal body-associated FliL family protein [Paracoccaceae bacterium]